MKTDVINRAYSVVHWKAVDEEKRLLEGVATSIAPDRMDDVIEPEGVEFKLPLPLLYQHNSRQPIGQVIAAKVSKTEITVKAQVAPAGVATFIDEAWALIKAGLIPGFSIGFRSLEDSYDRETGGFHFIRTEWIELSVVTIPANAEATITAVKSADTLARAALGRERATVRLNLNLPGDSGAIRSKGKAMTIQEQITSFENKRAASSARMTAIMDKAGTEGRTLEEAEQQEYDSLETEVKSIDEHLVRLRAHEKRLVATATLVTPQNTNDATRASETRGGSNVITVKSNLPKGTMITRYAICLYNAKGNIYVAADLAKQYYKDMPELELVLRAAVAAGNTTDTTWASPLIPAAQQMQGEFLELLRPASVLGRIPGLRRVPFNITIPAQSGGGTYGWVGEGAAKPVTKLAFTAVSLDWAKVAGIIVMTQELMRFSNPSAETIIRDDMVKGTAQFIDTQFVDPTVAAIINNNRTVTPASVTNGVTAVPATGTTAAAFRTDMKSVFANYLGVNDDPTNTVILMSATVALNLSLLMNPLGQPEFPDLNMKGGTILGLPVVVSQAVGNRIIVLRADEILLADDGPAQIDVSEQASVVMDDNPQASPQTTSLVSFWQRNLVGLRVDKYINWKKARSTSVQYISNAAYGG